MLSPEDLDEVNQPANPKLNETVHQFLLRQKRLADERKYPPGTIFQCIRCGDCCRYNYFHMNIEEKSLLDQLHMLGKNPHGYWALMDDGKLTCYMPLWNNHKSNMLSFEGPLPERHIDFLMQTKRRHGYWILATEIDEIIVYNPTPCMHLIDGTLASCAIYDDRPEICRTYICRRYPLKNELDHSR